MPAGARWLVHALGLRPNPLRRRLDRVVAAAVLGMLVVAVSVVPMVALSWGTAAYEADRHAAERAAATRYRVDAVVIEEPTTVVLAVNPEVSSTTHRAPVQWTGTDGAPRAANVEVPPGTTVGSRIPLWIDDADRVTTAPLSEGQVRTSAVALAFGVFLTGEALCAAGIAGVLAAANARADRAWHREWEIVEPKWTRHGG
ncbi:hypothetical protein GCM10011581_31690 [Saccharopolyspora subtropica]|uniref:Transmembrane protein n=1 Tax=Saccharopolyspora thermophila TaxID=89367 RepID=A0A917JYD1_9PSEU|nr:hypothetical protein GCM10011581_31690 [Saccharopolyspora subtropica]